MSILKNYIIPLETNLKFWLFRREPTAIELLFTEVSGAPIHFPFWLLLLGATGSRKAQGELLGDQISLCVPYCNKLIWAESTKKLRTPPNNFAKRITFSEFWTVVTSTVKTIVFYNGQNTVIINNFLTL